MTKGERTEQFYDEIDHMDYDDVQALWHACAWKLACHAQNVSSDKVRLRMIQAIVKMFPT